jgi:hypothetical protein
MHQMRISTNQVSSVVLRPKKLEIRKIVKTVKEPNKPNTVPWNWAKSVEAMHEGKNPSFWDEFIKFTPFLEFYLHSYFQASTKVLSNWAVETLGDL